MARRNLKVVPPAPAPVILTPEAKAANALRYIEQTCESDISYAQRELDSFALKLAKDPCNAFEWSNGAFKQAAKLKAAKLIQDIVGMGKEKTIDEYTSAPSPITILRETRRIVYDDVLRAARWPEHSTSVQSNVMATELAAAKAEWLKKLDRLVARIEGGE